MRLCMGTAEKRRKTLSVTDDIAHSNRIKLPSRGAAIRIELERASDLCKLNSPGKLRGARARAFRGQIGKNVYLLAKYKYIEPCGRVRLPYIILYVYVV